MPQSLTMASANAPYPAENAAARDHAHGAALPPSFQETYARHFDDVWRMVGHLGVPEADREDVVQDVFLIVLRRLATFEGRSSLRTWLYGITLRVVRDRRRSGRRMARHHEPCDADVATVVDVGRATPLESAAKNQAVALLAQLLDALDHDRRDVFIMVELEQMTVPEAAELLGDNVNTVYTRLRLARSDFERALDRHRARAAWGAR
jgi:RNA polymerase sigma-70 factor (ECF subfamily)